MTEANWEIREGGEYRVTLSSSSYGGHFRRVTAIDGDRIHYESFFGDEPEEIFTRDHVDARVFRNMHIPEDQSPIKYLVEALTDSIRTLSFLSEVNMQRRDDGMKLRELAECRKEGIRILPKLRAALAKAESVSPQEVAG